MTVWDVADLPVRDRLAFWHDALCAAFVPLRSDPEPGDRPFAGRVENRPMGPMMRSVLSSHPQRTAHGPRQVSATDGEYYFLNLQLTGRCRVRQRDADHVAEAGQLVLVDTTAPYWFDQDQDWSIMSFRLPKALVDERCDGAGVRVAEPLPRDGAGAVISALMPAVWRTEAESVSATEMTGVVIAAVAAQMRAHPIGSVSPREARRAEVLRHVRRHLSDPGLSVESTGRALNLSPRAVHAVFDGTDQTFGGTVREMRLRKAMKLLTDPGRLRTVTEVADCVGFVDPSSFTRAFRRHFGSTPTEMRSRPRPTGTG